MATQRKIEGQGYFNNEFYPVIGTELFWRYENIAGLGSLSPDEELLNHKLRMGAMAGIIDGPKTQTNRREQVLNRGIVFYALPENSRLSIEDAVKTGVARIVCSRPFSAANQNLELDENENLVLKLANFHLENMGEGGNVLMTKDGQIVQVLDAHGFIHPANIETGIYPVTIYKHEKIGANVETVGTKYNYLYPDGKLAFSSHMERSEEPSTLEVPARIRMTDPHTKKRINITSPRYVHDVGTRNIGYYENPVGGKHPEVYTPDFFHTAIDLLIANRLSKNAIMKDDRELVLKAHKRYQDMSSIFSLLNNKLQNGSIPQEQYDEIMGELKDEIEKTDYFLSNMETDQDRALFEEAEDDFVF